jgi:hypothetical protein
MSLCPHEVPTTEPCCMCEFMPYREADGLDGFKLGDKVRYASDRPDRSVEGRIVRLVHAHTHYPANGADVLGYCPITKTVREQRIRLSKLQRLVVCPGCADMGIIEGEAGSLLPCPICA